MKTIITFSAILLTSMSMGLSAQITINRTDFGVIGDLILYANDTTLAPTFNVGPTGANVTWDFSATVGSNFYDSASFEDPTAFSGPPEEANLAIVEGGAPEFFNITDSTVKIIIPVDFLGGTNPQILISRLPITYGGAALHDSSKTTIQGTPEEFGYSGLPFDSMRINFNIHTMSLVDGWGTLKTPDSTYDALRVKNETKVKISIEGKVPIIGSWVNVPVDGLDQNQTAYGWYAKNQKFTVAEAELDTIGNITSFRYQVSSIPTTGLANLSKTVISSFQPNPANDVLKIAFNSNYAEKGTLLIFDITGKVILNQEISITKNENEITVKTSELNNGIYFTRILSDHTNSSSKFVVKH